MTFYNWIQLILVCFMGAVSPGPSLALIINNTIKKSKFDGIITSIGHGIGVGLYALCAVLGLGILIDNYSSIYIGFQITGSCFLIFIGLHTILYAKKNETKETQNFNITSTSSFVQGFLIAFLNPKILVFFTALFSQFIYANAILLDKIILVLTPGIIDTIWYIFVTIIVTIYSINKFIQKNAITIQKLIGALLIIIAVSLLYRLI